MGKIKKAPNVWITEKDKTTGDLSSSDFKKKAASAADAVEEGGGSGNQHHYPTGDGDFNADFNEDFY